MEIKAIRCGLLEHGYTTQTNNSCCKIMRNSPVSTFNFYTKSPFYQSVKKSMDAGEWHDACEICRKVESQNLHSMRLTHSYLLNEKSKENDIKSLKHLTIFVGNECNLQCRSCHPAYSSSWEREVLTNKELYSNKRFYQSTGFKKINNFYNIDEEDLSSLEEVVFLGGEPIYNKSKIYQYLEKIFKKTNGKCFISFISNCTNKLDFENFDYLNQFANISVICSIDAVDKPSEFIRTGSNWTKVNSVIDYYKSKNIYLSVHPTNSALNIFEYIKILKWANQKNIKIIDLKTFVDDPQCISYKILTDKEKQIYKNLTKHDEQLNHIYNMLDNTTYDSNLRNQFFEYMEVTKQIYKMDWRDYLPDLYNLMHHFA